MVSFAIVTLWSPIRSRWMEPWSTARIEPEVGRHGRLLGENLLDLLLDRVVAPIDLVVEGDDLVAELDVLRLECVDRAPHGPEHERALLLEGCLEHVEGVLELDACHQPNRPVT